MTVSRLVVVDTFSLSISGCRARLVAGFMARLLAGFLTRLVAGLSEVIFTLLPRDRWCEGPS